MGQRALNFPGSSDGSGAKRFAPLSEKADYASTEYIVLWFLVIVGAAVFMIALRKLWRKGEAEEQEQRRASSGYEGGSSVSGRFRKQRDARKAREREGPGTWDLDVGDHLRLSFTRVGLACAASITNMSDDGFVVNIPSAIDDEMQPVIADHVRGFLLRDEVRWSFQSSVTMIYLGGMHAVRIAHTGKLRITNRRDSPRVKLRGRVRYGYLPSSAVANDSALLTNMESALHETHEAELEDLSVDGCSIRTKTLEPIEPGDLIMIRSRFLREEEEISVLCDAIKISPVPSSGSDNAGLVVGLRFISPNDLARTVIERTLHTHQKEVVG